MKISLNVLRVEAQLMRNIFMKPPSTVSAITVTANSESDSSEIEVLDTPSRPANEAVPDHKEVPVEFIMTGYESDISEDEEMEDLVDEGSEEDGGQYCEVKTRDRHHPIESQEGHDAPPAKGILTSYGGLP